MADGQNKPDSMALYLSSVYKADTRASSALVLDISSRMTEDRLIIGEDVRRQREEFNEIMHSGLGNV